MTFHLINSFGTFSHYPKYKNKLSNKNKKRKSPPKQTYTTYLLFQQTYSPCLSHTKFFSPSYVLSQGFESIYQAKNNLSFNTAGFLLRSRLNVLSFLKVLSCNVIKKCLYHFRLKIPFKELKSPAFLTPH